LKWGISFQLLFQVGQALKETFLLSPKFRFTEMPTNNYIESSFWNFDTLFQPQQHPARDAHDTFFMKGFISLHLNLAPGT